MTAIDSKTPAADTRGGTVSALLAYGMWGVLPLLFREIEKAGAINVVAYRTLCTLVLVGVVLGVLGRMGDVLALFRDRRTFTSISASSLLLALNWLLYVWAIETGHVLEASFGYFINPLVNIAIGMVLLGERQSRWQAVAIITAVIAIAIRAIGIGGVPYISLGLALSFGFYGYIRKTARLSPSTGLMAETIVMAPLAALYVIWSLATVGPGILADPLLAFLAVMTGPATAVPLLLFAYAMQQLRMTTMGMFQYIAPSLQFLLAITVFGEQLSGVGLLSFGLIWLSLAVFSIDSFWRRPGRAGV